MSDPNAPGQDATPTEALQLADQQPVAAAAPVPAPAAPASGRSHTRTILEIVGGVVAAGLIVVAGGVGFAVGHATANHDDRWGMAALRDGDSRPGADGQQGWGPGQGMPGQQGWGQGPQGFDRDGDQGPGGMMGGMMGGYGPRGVDPDGDNWTGQGGALPGQPAPQQAPGQQPAPQPTSPSGTPQQG